MDVIEAEIIAVYYYFKAIPFAPRISQSFIFKLSFLNRP